MQCDEARPSCRKCDRGALQCGGYIREHKPLLRDELKAAFSDKNLDLRSRSGCLTCKRRKLRCDEDHPCCKRCLSASRVCTWPSSTGGSPNSDIGQIVIYEPGNVPRSPNSQPDATINEKRSIAYFLANTAAQLSSWPQSRDRWWSYILQISEAEPAIRHGIVAVGALHEEFEGSTVASPSGYTPMQPLLESHLAVRQYNKALRMVWSASRWRNRDAPLLASLLFAMFDSLRGRPEPALFHRCSGLRMLKERDLEGGSPMKELILDIFIHFDTENLELGEPDFTSPADCTFPSTWITRPIQSVSRLEDTCQTFEVLFNRLLRAFKEESGTLHSGIGPARMLPEIFTRYEDWCLALDAYLQACACNLQTLDGDSINDLVILQIRRLMVKILLHVDLRSDDLDFDNFNADFECIVLLAECHANGLIRPDVLEGTNHSKFSGALRMSTPSRRHPTDYVGPRQSFLGISAHQTPLVKNCIIDKNVLGATQPVVSLLPRQKHFTPSSHGFYASSRFSLAPGVITALYITASNCRDPSIRRRALILLEATHRKEGQWDSLVCAANARITVTAEEARARHIAAQNAGEITEPLNNIIHSSWQVPDAARLRGFESLMHEADLDEKANMKRFEWVARGHDWHVVVPGCTTQ